MTDPHADDELLLSIPRAKRTELRVIRSVYRGEPRTHVREWFNDEGTWKPGKGIALRSNELLGVIEALQKVANQRPPT